MNDREPLEAAAKAAGYVLTWEGDNPPYPRAKQGHMNPPWNPLEDDGDAFRLAVKLELLVDVRGDASWVSWDVKVKHLIPHGADAAAATRRAIVLVAAEFGKTRG